MEIDKKILEIIKKITLNKEGPNWKSTSKFEPLRIMDNPDIKGEVGEMLLHDVLKDKFEVKWERANTIDSEDIQIEGIKIEVKLATLGKNSSNFQHENFFKGRIYDAVIFLDFCPDTFYITYGLKSNIIWENLHQRTNSIINEQTNESENVKTNTYKFDISLKNLKENNISGRNGKKLKFSITKEIKTEEDLISFIQLIIKDYESQKKTL